MVQESPVESFRIYRNPAVWPAFFRQMSRCDEMRFLTLGLPNVSYGKITNFMPYSGGLQGRKMENHWILVMLKE